MKNKNIRAFWFHYNKPEASRRGKPVWTVHYKGVCHLVENVEFYVPLKTRVRRTQPRGVLCGKGIVTIVGNTAVIRNK